ncbi:HEXXH motif domain-containing protein [Streptomyces flaveus]|uniref:HEXXH motif domain-containing protein n=1 Tax=Streptomyces flaveus TaxID=66370 RepID=UPI00332A0C80
MPGEPEASGDLPFHQLSAVSLQALSRGEGGASVVAEILAAERSRRLLLLRALDEGMSKGADASDAEGLSAGAGSSEGGPPQAPGTAISHQDAWSLLERVQRQAPEVFEDVLMSPPTGRWVSLALHQMRGKFSDDAPLWVVLGHLSALAAAAAARAGLDFAIAVPVRRGLVQLPTLGCAVLPVREQWSVARIEARQGTLRITGEYGEVLVPRDAEAKANVPDWHPVRRVVLESGDRPKHLTLEELDPYRTFPRPSEPRLLSAAEAGTWEGMLADAWKILLRDEPESAEAMRYGLLAMVPASTRERFRPYSGTAGDAFGGVTASRPDDAAQLAATLVHEFQHTKLGGLIHLQPLVRFQPAQDPEELFYAPWRDDPRPLRGLLQGIYAFVGVTRFWRVHRYAADAGQVPSAHFEFALWRTQVWSTLNLVRGHERLTPLGRYVIEGLRERSAQWLADPVPDAELALAREAVADHRARWRAYHLRPPAAAVEDAVRAWQRGDAQAPAGLAAEPELVPDSEVPFLDSAAVLARYRLSEPDGAWRHIATQDSGVAGGVEGASAADVLLACDDRAGARDALVAELSGKGASVAAWAGLGRALAGEGQAHRAASRLLLRFPERARAVHEAVEAVTGQAPDPVRLAAWLGQGEATERQGLSGGSGPDRP